MKKSLWILGVCLALSACVGRSDPATFYTLKPLNVSKANVVSDVFKARIDVNRVKVPAYIDKPQIVTTKDDVELTVSETNRWGEALTTLMQRTLVDDLNALLPGANVQNKNYIQRTGDYTVFMEVVRLDATLGGKTAFEANWHVLNGDGKMVANGRNVLVQPTGETYADMVETLSGMTGYVAKEIAQKLAGMK